jgi:hypothetical protein
MSRHSTRSWRANSFSTSQYLEARLTKATWIVRTAIRGHPDDNYWVKKYKIQQLVYVSWKKRNIRMEKLNSIRSTAT